MSESIVVFSKGARERLRSIRHVALDMDGTIYLGSRLFPATLPFLERLAQWGIAYTFLTNNSSKSRDDYWQKLVAMGLPVTPEHILTSTHGLIDYLRNDLPEVRRLFILGTPCLHNEMGLHGYLCSDDAPDAVVVGFDTTISYNRLCRAAWWIAQGKPFLATHPDLVCPTDQPTILVDCGALCKALEAATGRTPTVIGKPHSRMLEPILRKTGLSAKQVAVVGDRLMTDIVMAKRTRALAVLVLTGEATLEDVAALPERERPDIVLSHVGLLGDLLAGREQESELCAPKEQWK